MLFYGYLGRMFGPLAAKRYLCYHLLRFVEEPDDLVVNQELLRPDHSYPGLPGTFSVSHDLYSYLRWNSVAVDYTCRIILDCEIAGHATRVVPQSLFEPYAGLPRSQAELQSASLLPPIFFIRQDHTVGLSLEAAKSAESYSSMLLYNDWRPMEGKASIKLRITWCGYKPWQTQIQLRNRRKEPITLPRLIQLVASGVDRFLRQEHEPITTHPSFFEWKIGNYPAISPDRIVLVGVVAVSSGSIMPILRLAD
ncbi:hypothetical protein F5148DRAFT_1280696 [Russula earlei]|uniref:Uncharacterized protein n=1 Tax=Russula earlei TaxID=71964 RepID=A0ACC0UKL9_9AGAM|nr:hypothetical protein F5148DRAFT_1280696 [Russula earlei]